MAEQARLTYSDISFDVCYTSPLVRAVETAKIFLQGKDIPIITDDRLREMCFGEYEGTENVLDKPNCPMFKLFDAPETYVAVGGAESLEALYARTGEFLREVIAPELSVGKTVLIIGHGAMNSSIINKVKNIPIENFWEYGRKNCELIKLI